MRAAERVEVRALEAEAAAWIAQLQSGKWSAADRAGLREWCSRGPAHCETLRRMCATWADLDELWVVRESLRDAASREPTRLRWNGFWALHAVLFAVALVSMASWFGQHWRTQARMPSVEMYSTHIGEQRTIVLADRSTVRLNTNSILEVNFRPDQRRVRIVKGEALFAVAKDKNRPFVVNAAGVSVRAVGTRFCVRLGRDDVEVVVSEGTVSLARSDAGSVGPELPKTRLPLLQPEQIAVVEDRATEPIRITTVNVHEVDKRLSWTEGVLEFDGEPLEKVIAEVSRYTSLKITIADPELRQVPVGGRFKIGQTQALFDVIEAGFHAHVIASKDGDGVLITAAQGDAR